MPLLSVRISPELSNAIDKTYKRQGFQDKSEYVRYILENSLVDTPVEADWKVKIWTIFGIDAEKFRYAFKRSENVEEFFSIISKWSKIPIKLKYSPKEISLTFNAGGNIDISHPRGFNKTETIRNIVEELEKAMLNALS